MKQAEPMVLIVSGPSGSGKSTLVKKTFGASRHAVVGFVHDTGAA